MATIGDSRRDSLHRFNRRLTAAVSVVLLACSFTACSLPNSNANSTVAVDDEGLVTETIVESTNGDTYTEDELEEYIENEITQSGIGTVSLDSCSISNDSVEIVMKYDSVEDYSAFNGVPCFIGTLQEAEEAGYDIWNQTYYDSAGNVADRETLEQRAKEWKIFIVSEPIYVRVPDKILYATDNVSITGRLTAHVTSVMDDSEDTESTSALTGSASSDTSTAGSDSAAASEDADTNSTSTSAGTSETSENSAEESETDISDGTDALTPIAAETVTADSSDPDSQSVSASSTDEADTSVTVTNSDVNQFATIAERYAYIIYK